MKPQNQPMILPRQIIAGISELLCIPILLSFSVDVYVIKIMLLLFWITISETLAPSILKKAGIYGLKKTSLYYLPFYIFIVPLAFNANMPQVNWLSLIGGSFSVSILLYLNRKEINNVVNSIESRRPITKDKLVVKLIMNLMPIISEEILFRGFWITCNANETQVSIIITSALIFVYAHFINRWANVIYNVKSYVMQFVLGLILASVFVQTKSLITCCFLHFLYNISDYILLIKRYRAKEQSCLFNDYG